MNNAKFNKIIGIFTIITSVITLISVVFSYIIPMYIINQLDLNVNNAKSIGIIGGADGPTAIFVTGNHFTSVTSIIFFAISIIGISYLIYARKKVK